MLCDFLCFQTKCVETKLQDLENSCIDNCVYKYFDVTQIAANKLKQEMES